MSCGKSFIGGSAKNITDKQYVSILKKVKDRMSDLNIITSFYISDEERNENSVKI